MILGVGVVPPDVILALEAAYDRSSVDDFWDTWSMGAEMGFLGQITSAPPPPPDSHKFALLWLVAFSARSKRPTSC